MQYEEELYRLHRREAPGLVRRHSRPKKKINDEIKKKLGEGPEDVRQAVRLEQGISEPLANLKAIRKRISSVKSTQKITRAQKMVAGARLTRSQQRILALRPYAVKTGQVLAEVAGRADDGASSDEHPLLARRAEKTVLLLVITSDRGLCGAFNTNILRAAAKMWHEREAAGETVKIVVIGRKGRDFFRRRNAPVLEVLTGVWERVDIEQARTIARKVLTPFVAGQVDSIYLVYNEFKSAMSQRVVTEPLFPLQKAEPAGEPPRRTSPEWASHREYLFEPNRKSLMRALGPDVHRDLDLARVVRVERILQSFGARMTAMESATKKAAEMIGKYTLIYNRARQAAITTELMEIIGGAEGSPASSGENGRGAAPSFSRFALGAPHAERARAASALEARLARARTPPPARAARVPDPAASRALRSSSVPPSASRGPQRRPRRVGVCRSRSSSWASGCSCWAWSTRSPCSVITRARTGCRTAPAAETDTGAGRAETRFRLPSRRRSPPPRRALALNQPARGDGFAQANESLGGRLARARIELAVGARPSMFHLRGPRWPRPPRPSPPRPRQSRGKHWILPIVSPASAETCRRRQLRAQRQHLPVRPSVAPPPAADARARVTQGQTTLTNCRPAGASRVTGLGRHSHGLHCARRFFPSLGVL